VLFLLSSNTLQHLPAVWHVYQCVFMLDKSKVNNWIRGTCAW